MRTKTLLLTAALSAAGIATSMAQVFSVNAVGYVTTKIPAKGFALISNPLTAADNTIQALFKGAAPGTTVYKFTGTSFASASFDDIDNKFIPDSVANLTVLPGEGVFVFNPTAAEASFTFVGEVPQGTLKNAYPKGLSVRSSMVPQGGTAKDLGLKGAAGDTIYQFDPATQKYLSSSFDDIDNDWVPKLTPLAVGQAFILNAAVAASWDRTFSVN